MLYTFGEGSTLGASVARFLQAPIQQQTGLMEELALARASLVPVLEMFDCCDKEALIATDANAVQLALAKKMILADQLRDGLQVVAVIADKAARIQKEQLITPATLALLAAQIEQISQELFADSMPTVYNEFTTRIEHAMTCLTLVDSSTSAREVHRPWETAKAMDATVPIPEDWSDEDE